MKRTKLLTILCAAALLLSSCGGGMKSASAENGRAEAPAAAPMEVMTESAMKPDYDYAMDSSVNLSQTVSGGGGESVYQRADAKLIRRCSIEMQTTEFDAAIAALYALVEENEGYFENSILRGGGYYNANARRSGEYIVRVPAQRYNAFRTAAGEIAYVTYSNESTEDIGEQYYDTEARLKTLRTKQDRLLALLEKAETMEDIITLESELGSVEYEIERYSSTLNRYDGLVNYATFTLYINEVKKVEEATGEADSLADRMAYAFASGLDDLRDGAEDFLIWLSYNVFGVVFFVVIAGGVALLLRRKKFRLPRIGRKNRKNGDSEE